MWSSQGNVRLLFASLRARRCLLQQLSLPWQFECCGCDAPRHPHTIPPLATLPSAAVPGVVGDVAASTGATAVSVE